jgi:hypothetical protein
MPKEIITRKASDNPYFHKDFHIALNYGINYLHDNFGEEAVREYLAQFAASYYSLLKKSLLENGLVTIKEHYEKTYKIEDAEFKINYSPDEMNIHLFASPAVMHIKGGGHPVSPVFHETVLTVNKEICRNTPFECEMMAYNDENGAYKLRFYRRGR